MADGIHLSVPGLWQRRIHGVCYELRQWRESLAA